jgi:phosphoserine phosphatase
VLLLKRNPLWLLVFPFWWLGGRAHLKRQIAARVPRIDAARLPYIEPLLEFLRAAKRQGRPVILATASDAALVRQVAEHLGLFDEVLASDGRTNLRGAAKRRKLVEKFGERGFDYAGNSAVDLAVWRGARAAIVVNASASLVRRAAELAPVAATFCLTHGAKDTVNAGSGAAQIQR